MVSPSIVVPCQPKLVGQYRETVLAIAQGTIDQIAGKELQIHAAHGAGRSRRTRLPKHYQAGAHAPHPQLPSRRALTKALTSIFNPPKSTSGSTCTTTLFPPQSYVATRITSMASNPVAAGKYVRTSCRSSGDTVVGGIGRDMPIDRASTPLPPPRAAVSSLSRVARSVPALGFWKCSVLERG